MYQRRLCVWVCLCVCGWVGGGGEISLWCQTWARCRMTYLSRDRRLSWTSGDVRRTRKLEWLGSVLKKIVWVGERGRGRSDWGMWRMTYLSREERQSWTSGDVIRRRKPEWLGYVLNKKMVCLCVGWVGDLFVGECVGGGRKDQLMITDMEEAENEILTIRDERLRWPSGDVIRKES